MTADSLSSLRHAFHARSKPEKWLRDDLHPMDLEDGREFIDELKRGGSPEKYFLSAIPYPTFLTIEAGLYLLPDFLATITKDSIILFIEMLRKTKEEAWISDPRLELIELIKNRPNSER